ncbi:MAG: hypothetical protein GY768_26455 [Planctomycetaceae bacterium]|nr:hypothetical protein [Planctomycetaceae bacterium]
MTDVNNLVFYDESIKQACEPLGLGLSWKSLCFTNAWFAFEWKPASQSMGNGSRWEMEADGEWIVEPDGSMKPPFSWRG